MRAFRQNRSDAARGSVTPGEPRTSKAQRGARRRASARPTSIAALGALLATAACTDVVDLDPTFEEARPVVDAWLTDGAGAQTVYLSRSQDFYREALPDPIAGADVLVCASDGSSGGERCYTFAERADAPGAYTWTPRDGARLGAVGDTLGLLVTLPGGRLLAASSVMRRVPAIDSISFQFEESQLGLDEGTYAQVYARDLPGAGDRYLIRSTINDTLLNRPAEVNLAADAAFDGGTASDGIAFILPIRFGVNRLDDDGAPVPLAPGDRVGVEVWSLTEEAFRYLERAVEQIENGESALFSVPVVSTPGNVIDVDSGERALGMFSASAVSAAAAEFGG